MGGSAAATVSDSTLRSMPTRTPKVTIATSTPISSAMNGLPITSKTFWTSSSGSSITMSATRLGEHQDDRQQDGGDGDGERRAAVLGRPLVVGTGSNVVGASSTTHRPAMVP